MGGKANAIKPAPIWGHFFVNEEAGFERATQAQPGEKLSGGQFLARGRIPGFPNAVRRTVGGKANVIKPAPIRGHFFVNEEAGFEKATQAQPGENCPVDTFLVRGRIPAFPNAVRRTVGGKANAIKPAPSGGAFLLTKRRDSKGRPRRSLGKNCPVDTCSFEKIQN